MTKEAKAYIDNEVKCHAIHGSDPKVVRGMVRAGADLFALDMDGESVLHQAAAHNPNHFMIRNLIKLGLDVNLKGSGSKTPLHYAAGNNEEVQVIAALVDNGADLYVQDRWGDTPLHWACSMNPNMAVIEYLVDQMELTNQVNDRGRTAWDCLKQNETHANSNILWKLA